MARIRSVKPSLRTSRVVASWPYMVRYFWVLLWGYLDDKGRGLDIPRTIAADCFPLDEDVTPAKVDRWLDVIAQTKVGNREPPLCRYEVDGNRYLHALNWGEHQKPNRPSPSQHPNCPIHGPFTESGSEPAVSPHVLEGDGEVGDRRGEGDSLSQAPLPWCSKHPGGTETPCGACRQARIVAGAREADRRARLAAIPDCPRHPGSPATNCGPCRSEAIAPTEEPT